MQLLDTDSLSWVHLPGDESFGYPIDYWGAIVSARPDGHVDVVFRWEPNSYCHFHRHLVDTTSVVLQGEHHVVEIENGKEIAHKVRLPGDYAHKPAGDVHMEYAGPEGSVVLFHLYAPDGKLFEVLDRDENVLAVGTIETLQAGAASR
ncbi:MAG: hypothetical protein QNK03_13320 [Myxococcota bacterium]|nr:hypothetical protein [Myxococcota bacterium]